jgi:hypothetical protein
MRKLITLEGLKQHLNIELTEIQDDKFLLSLIEVAQDTVSE